MASTDYRDLFLVPPGHPIKLNKIDPGFKGHHDTEESAKQEMEHYRRKLSDFQTLLYAQKEHSLLIVLQAIDAGGKDGTVRHVFGAFNPQGASVTAFKVPTALELAH